MLNDTLRAECGRAQNLDTGLFEVHGVCIWRPDDHGTHETVRSTVGEFLDRPEHQSGAWLIDGGWGGPPGPVRVRWVQGDWVNDGFPPWRD